MELKIKLLKSEILHEVMNETYIAGKSRFNGDNNEFVYNMQAAEDDAHTNKLLRSMEANMEELKTQLSYFLKNGTDVESDNIQSEIKDDDDAFELTLDVTSRFNKAYTPTISTLSHKFITNKMIFEWYTTTKPDEAKIFYELAMASLKQIKASFFKMPPVRPVHKPAEA